MLSASITKVNMSHINRKFEYGWITNNPARSIRSFSSMIAFTEPNLFTLWGLKLETFKVKAPFIM